MSCGTDWRLLSLDLKTGLPRRYLTPINFTFEQVLNAVGNGSISLGVRDVSLRDVWVHATSIAFLRIAGEGASPTSPVCEFIGLVDGADPSSGGTLNVGLKSIEEYLNHRIIHGDQSYESQMSSVLCKTLVDQAIPNGIPLSAQAETIEGGLMDREYLDTDQKKILEAVLEICGAENGPDYDRVHNLEGDGSWSTTLVFKPRTGSSDPISIYSSLGATEYSLAVDGETHATRVIGIGADPSLISDTGMPSDSIYPLFERSEAWSDITEQENLDQLTAGDLRSNKDPVATPSMTLAGLDLAPRLTLGGTIDLHLEHGAIRYHGDARLTSKSWASGSDGPTTVALTMVPMDNTVEAILNSTPTN